jgi:hypothetical protein
VLTRPAALAATLAAAAALAAPAAVPARAACDPASSVVLTCVKPVLDRLRDRVKEICLPPDPNRPIDSC